jgi:hypothetical protein
MVSMTEVFWVGFYTSAIAFVLALSRQIYKSKCKSFRCCGCELVRDVEAEEKIDELELERHPTTLPSDTKTLPS